MEDKAEYLTDATELVVGEEAEMSEDVAIVAVLADLLADQEGTSAAALEVPAVYKAAGLSMDEVEEQVALAMQHTVDCTVLAGVLMEMTAAGHFFLREEEAQAIYAFINGAAEPDEPPAWMDENGKEDPEKVTL